MSKAKTMYVCAQCGAKHPKWSGQCTDCGEWNCLSEARAEPVVSHRAKPSGGGYAGQAAAVTRLDQVSMTRETRMTTGISEFDRVLGGGLVSSAGSSPPPLRVRRLSSSP